MKYLDGIQKDALKMDAINTAVYKKNELIGYNTDYLGVLNSIRGKNINLKGKKILVLGAGGAGVSAIYGLKKYNNKIIIINRTEKKAKELAKKFNVTYKKYDNFKHIIQEVDILISTIPVNKFPFKLKNFPDNLIIFNAYYKTNQLENFAKSRDLRYIDGLDWLINQAVPAYRVFLNRSIDKNKIKNLNLGINRKNIGIIGFMKAGKSTVGRKLADKLGKDFVDIDRLIEKEEDASVNDIFLKKGEGYFRKLEEKIILNLKCKDCVIAYGGGIVKNPKILRKLKNFSYNIWLWVSPENVLGRKDSNKRPLLKNNKNELSDMIKNRFNEYFRTADLIINTDNKRKKDVIKQVTYEVNNLLG
jgi:shikimate dehydrogenase